MSPNWDLSTAVWNKIHSFLLMYFTFGQLAPVFLLNLWSQFRRFINGIVSPTQCGETCGERGIESNVNIIIYYSNRGTFNKSSSVCPSGVVYLFLWLFRCANSMQINNGRSLIWIYSAITRPIEGVQPLLVVNRNGLPERFAFPVLLRPLILGYLQIYIYCTKKGFARRFIFW